MLSNFLHDIVDIVDIIIFTIGFCVNFLFLWFPIINNIILNYLVFGFKNIRIHILNTIVILIQILLITVYIENKQDPIHFIKLVLWLIYMINNIVYFKKENKSIFYTIFIILLLSIIRMIIYGSFVGGISIYCNFTLGLVLLISNMYISNNYLTNKYLKYTTILINLAYIIIVIYFLLSLAINKDIPFP